MGDIAPGPLWMKQQDPAIHIAALLHGALHRAAPLHSSDATTTSVSAEITSVTEMMTVEMAAMKTKMRNVTYGFLPLAGLPATRVQRWESTNERERGRTGATGRRAENRDTSTTAVDLAG